MRITLLVVGKTDSRQIDDLTAVYTKRLQHYIPFNMDVIPDIKKNAKTDQSRQKELEGQEILKRLDSSDLVVLLDERGKSLTSLEFADYLEKKMVAGLKRVVFIIGGPYGFSNDVYDRADDKISLSKMTFSHQMIRIFIIEQIYRSMTILKNEPYHHE
ncbi:23S rRNA (pseudouridine(1915)-N(3))-methyltransferase RlmH [Porphyromonas pogonae]|uniref:23S rRNA (pseudouridine(1915)-N(3))-methyltransferase RlmH n=1 Tax=Porphyromonas pogonae TaxID=867595 RepID=UPI002E79D9AD|nr:23S rRNA (pseudouridine(1915)-N(3))-methyltransferase RlmH [Porphyromonas pogonae]